MKKRKREGVKYRREDRTDSVRSGRCAVTFEPGPRVTCAGLGRTDASRSIGHIWSFWMTPALIVRSQIMPNQISRSQQKLHGKRAGNAIPVFNILRRNSWTPRGSVNLGGNGTTHMMRTFRRIPRRSSRMADAQRDDRWSGYCKGLDTPEIIYSHEPNGLLKSDTVYMRTLSSNPNANRDCADLKCPANIPRYILGVLESGHALRKWG